MSRTRSRELALQCLYQYDLRGEDARESAMDQLAGADPEAREYAEALIRGVRAEEPALSDRLKTLVEHWAWDRVAVLDRCILRIGAWELLHAPELPHKVAMDEAIELAKRFSTRDSGAFVNGVLDRLHRERAAPAAPPGAP